MIKTPEEDFFSTRLPLPGLTAVAVRLSDGKLIHHCFERRILPGQARQALARLIQEEETLLQYQIEPRRTTWLFEHLRIEAMHRSDKACLVLFLANRPDVGLDAAEAVLEDFAHLALNQGAVPT
jgi:hypothetical protein